MKKIIGILAMSFVLTTGPVYAEDVATGDGSCVGGKEVIDAAGHHYCQGNGEMTWYGAVAWCQSQGRHLASIYEACDSDPSKKVPSNCPNIVNGEKGLTQNSWTSSNKDSSLAYYIDSYGAVPFGDRRKSYHYALCW